MPPHQTIASPGGATSLVLQTLSVQVLSDSVGEFDTSTPLIEIEKSAIHGPLAPPNLPNHTTRSAFSQEKD